MVVLLVSQAMGMPLGLTLTLALGIAEGLTETIAISILAERFLFPMTRD
jgi:hypothetical protein